MANDTTKKPNAPITTTGSALPEGFETFTTNPLTFSPRDCVGQTLDCTLLALIDMPPALNPEGGAKDRAWQCLAVRAEAPSIGINAAKEAKPISPGDIAYVPISKAIEGLVVMLANATVQGKVVRVIMKPVEKVHNVKSGRDQWEYDVKNQKPEFWAKRQVSMAPRIDMSNSGGNLGGVFDSIVNSGAGRQLEAGSAVPQLTNGSTEASA